MKRMLRRILVGIAVTTYVLAGFRADTYQLPDGTLFYADYYAEHNQDVVQALGSDAKVLADHYWYNGIPEGRLPYAGAKDVSASSVIALVNEYRSRNGLNSLAADPVLSAAAQARARELADNDFFAHTRLDGSKWNTVLGKDRSTYTKVAENLGRGQSSASAVIYAWQKSPIHNQVMLLVPANKIGVGVAKSASGKFYFCLIIGQTR